MATSVLASGATAPRTDREDCGAPAVLVLPVLLTAPVLEDGVIREGGTVLSC